MKVPGHPGRATASRGRRASAEVVTNVLAAAAVVALLAGISLRLAGLTQASDPTLVIATASLLAMAGALALGQYLAGAVIAVMLSGGNALEVFAVRRARRELTALVSRAPKTAAVRAGGLVHEVPIDAVATGDTAPSGSARHAPSVRSRSGPPPEPRPRSAGSTPGRAFGFRPARLQSRSVVARSAI